MIKKPMPSPKKPLKPAGPNQPVPGYNRGPFTWLLIGLAVMLLLWTLKNTNRVQQLKFSAFETYVESRYIETAVLNESGRKIKGEFTDAAVETLKIDDKPVAKDFEVRYAPEMLPKNYTQWLKKYGVSDYDASGESWVLPLLGSFLPFLLLIAL
ncbi:MAG: ATP-dependent metallopeptidase FtsH/Yme1/Tma family protein, partial [Planctomycetota bacterium]